MCGSRGTCRELWCRHARGVHGRGPKGVFSANDGLRGEAIGGQGGDRGAVSRSVAFRVELRGEGQRHVGPWAREGGVSALLAPPRTSPRSPPRRSSRGGQLRRRECDLCIVAIPGRPQAFVLPQIREK
ncbi:hypothetical protein T484DRAFT_1987445 [Baffinella frigidus]|nr:hypothetical protein T484DRAFT_1987445 [Cryptophyta sp. CCMP2293]